METNDIAAQERESLPSASYPKVVICFRVSHVTWLIESPLHQILTTRNRACSNTNANCLHGTKTHTVS